MSRPHLEIIICSTRPGRVGLPVAEWFAGRARDHGAFDIEVVDLAEVDLLLFDEPAHPRLRQYTHDHTKRWSAVVDRADAYVFVLPEYNFGFTAATKNAIDYVFEEWQDKAVGFVSYGGLSGGTRAVQMLKQVVTAMKMVPVYEAVNIPFVARLLDDEGRIRPTEEMGAAAVAMLDELARWDTALASLRHRPTTE